MDIINIDENGNVLKNVDWTIWQRERVEEVKKDGVVTKIISYCVPIPNEIVEQDILEECERNLELTDYISSKFGDSLIKCATIEEIQSTIAEFNNTYKEVLSSRQEWRDTINRIQGKEVC